MSTQYKLNNIIIGHVFFSITWWRLLPKITFLSTYSHLPFNLTSALPAFINIRISRAIINSTFILRMLAAYKAQKINP